MGNVRFPARRSQCIESLAMCQNVSFRPTIGETCQAPWEPRTHLINALPGAVTGEKVIYQQLRERVTVLFSARLPFTPRHQQPKFWLRFLVEHRNVFQKIAIRIFKENGSCWASS